MNRKQRMPIYGGVVHAFSAIVSMSLPLLELRRDETPGIPGGVSILALPRALAVETQPLSGWECFPVRVEAGIPLSSPEPEALPPIPGMPGEATEGACVIELFGQVNEGENQLYCFLDRSRNRWFRLVEGGTDREAQVTLLKGEEGQQPVLLDTRTGQKFRIEAGNHQLIPILEQTPREQ